MDSIQTIRREFSLKDLRSFGLIVGGIFLALGTWPLLRHHSEARAWAIVLSVLLVLPATLCPRLLIWPYKLWMRGGAMLGYVNTRIILGCLFLLLVTPFGLLKRLFGKASLTLGFDKTLETYAISVKPRATSHFRFQF